LEYRYAWHEAGHATVGLVLGRSLVEVSIGLNGPTPARTRWDAEPDPAYTRDEQGISRARRDVKICLAGRAAQEHATGVSAEHESSKDYFEALLAAEAAGLIEDLGAPHAQSFLEAEQEKVRHLVISLWPAIHAVAEALVANETLDGSAVRRIVLETTSR
jgi:ATP-dependent Zn protease